jgi:serine/threonine protein kinase
MGTVYLAEHVAIEKKLALKVLLPEYGRKADLKERFLREARAAAAIDHPNIVDITDFGETPTNSVFFAMEYLDGHDLSHHIKESGPFPWARAKRITLQICRALGAAHAKQIIHRDMKPENVFLIDREGRPDFVKVLDFGIAKVSGSTDGAHRLTRTGMIFGTPEYMSPEQAQGHSPDHRVDIYAVGVIMYEMLTGKVPFKADTFMGILTKHIFEDPIPPSEMAPEAAIPLDVEEIVLKAMGKDRDERFQSMTEMASAVSQASGRVTRATGDVMPARVLSSSGGSAGADGRVAVPRSSPALPRPEVDTAVELDARLPVGRGRVVAIALVAAMLVVGGVAAALYGVMGQGGSKQAPASSAGSASDPDEPASVSIDVTSTPPGHKSSKAPRCLVTRRPPSNCPRASGA